MAELLSFKTHVRLTAGMSSAYLLVNDVANEMEVIAWKILEMGDFEESELEMIEGVIEVSLNELVSF